MLEQGLCLAQSTSRRCEGPSGMWKGAPILTKHSFLLTVGHKPGGCERPALNSECLCLPGSFSAGLSL